jgi:very-short-patch-repair endonuclease
MHPARHFAQTLRATPTDCEARMWNALRAGRLQGLKFKRQVPLGRYIVDFVCFGSRLVVEVDGGQHNGSVQDEVRDAWLQAQGFVVRRYWNHEVLGNLEGVLSDILQYASPSLPPLSREGREAFRNSHRPSQSDKSPSPLAGEGLGRGGGSPAHQPSNRGDQN